MISKKIVLAAALAASGLVAAPSFAGPNLVTNGSFEASTSQACPTAWSCSTTAFGAEPVSYWNGRAAGSNLATSPDGGNVLGTWNIQQVTEMISQTLTGLSIGATYSLSFYEAAANRNLVNFTAGGQVGWGVSIGGDSLGAAYVPIPGEASATPWYSRSYSFVATATSEVLSFLAQATVPIAPEPLMVLDGVNVQLTKAAPTPPTPPTPPVSAVPEPSTWALTLAGLAVIGGIARRRQARNA